MKQSFHPYLPVVRSLVGVLSCAMHLGVLDARIVLTSQTGSEGVSAETTEVTVDGAGTASVAADFSAGGGVSAAGAFNRKFSLMIDAVGLASDSGARLTDSQIDRDNSGRLGVRGGDNFGINLNEGFLIGIDAAELEPGHAWQLTGIRFEFIGPGESFTIVNRNDPSRKVTGASNSMVDVSDLGLRVNGGSADAEVVAVFANATGGVESNFRITGFELDAVKFAASADAPWRSVLYPENWQPPEGRSFYQDKFIQDFSYAGYKSGEAAVPKIAGPLFDVTTYGADPTGAVDSTAAIKAALLAARTAGGGVVSLPPGIFKIAHNGGSEVLRISGDGVVLRGAGPDQTFLLNTTVAMRNLATIRIRGLNPTEGTPVAIVADITTPTRRLHLADVSSFVPGDRVEILRDFTEAWILEHGQEAYWNAGTDIPDPANYRRRITAVDATENWIEVDVPMRYACLTRDNARVRKLAGRISGCGIEDLSIGNVQHPGSQWGESDYEVPGTAAYEVAFAWMIDVQRAFDCWVSNVRSFQPVGNTSTSHTPSNGIRLGSSKNITVRNCHLQRPQYGGGGGNGYMYRIQNSDDCLVADSIAEFNRHGFVVSHSGTTGNVFLRCEDRTTRRATGSGGSGYITGGDGSDNHMQFSHSNLWDRCSAADSFYDAIFRTTTGHGLSTAHGVYWNTRGAAGGQPYLVATEQGRYGYVIGTSGAVDEVKEIAPALHQTGPADHIEGKGLGGTLFPPSLYLDQLERRLGSGIHIASILPADGAATLESVIGIDGAGGAANHSLQEFEVSGRGAAEAVGSTIRVSFEAVASVSLEAGSYGGRVLAGVFDRDSAGSMGVAPGSLGTNGANREALHLVVDASALAPTARVAIDSVKLSFLGDGESCEVVHLGKGSLSRLLGGPGTYPHFDFDVSALGLVVEGGSIATIAAIIPGPTSELRVRGLVLSVTMRDGISIRSTSSSDGASMVDLGIGTGSSGFASTLDPGFAIDGSAALAGPGRIGVTLDAMARVETVNDIGAKLVDGVIDRDSSGRFGVAPGGINEFEGIGIILDATACDPRIAMQVSSVTVQFVDADESLTIVNRSDPSRRRSYGGSLAVADTLIGPGIAILDVRDLDLSMAGGQLGDVATVIGNDMPDAGRSFRLSGIELMARPVDPWVEKFEISSTVGSSIRLDWRLNSLFDKALLYRTDLLGKPWTLLGSFPRESNHVEAVDVVTGSGFYRIEIPVP